MSEGCGDAAKYYRELFDELMEHHVEFIEYLSAKNNMEASREESLAREMSKKFSTLFCTQAFWDAIDFKSAAVAELFVNRIKSNKRFSVEELLFLLNCSRQFAKLARLQKVTRYYDKLLIFFDEKFQMMPNGVHYQDPNRQFMDGDQDILLGYTKKRYLNRHFLHKDRPLIIVASWNMYRKNWRLEDVIQ